MKEKAFQLDSEYIELIKLLKLMNVAMSGSHAKYLVDEQEVQVNGAIEHRYRAKIRTGDTIEVTEYRIRVS